MKIITGGVTAAKGFEAAGVEAAIKYKNRKDMAIIYSQKPCVLAGTFTSNVVKAAPVLWDKKVVEESPFGQAVIVNAGIANACTGKEGYDYCKKTASKAAAVLDIPEDSVLVASTGVIGMQLPMERLEAGIKMLAPKLNNSRKAAHEAACAIMTTDTKSKEVAVTFEVDGKEVTVGGMCKGSGMIHPNMATMLSVIATDASIGKELLQQTLSGVVGDTFNMISVDRDTSTNDTCVILANGESGIPEIQEGTEAYEEFREAVFEVACELAKKMAADGEGCTRLLEVKTVNAESVETAKILAKSVITSNLVKTAVYGSDANWGRILCALGYSGVEFDPEVVDLTICAEPDGKHQELIIVKDGVATDYSEEFATKLLSQDKVTVVCDMKQGEASATAWGCDLTYDYVKINGDYRS